MTRIFDSRPWLAPLVFIALFVLAPLVPGGYALYIFTDRKSVV